MVSGITFVSAHTGTQRRYLWKKGWFQSDICYLH